MSMVRGSIYEGNHASDLLTLCPAKARGMVQEIEHPVCGPIKVLSPPVKYSNANPSIRFPPPLLGEHTNEVLQEVAGLSAERVEELRAKGVIA
jgi:succinate--hydroxymethylglutarate CoA-transferase